MRYYAKELPGGDCWLPNGQKIHVDFVGVDEMGYIATSVGYVISQLDQAVREHVGGWLNTTVEVYDDALKKKEAQPPPKSPSPFRADRRGLFPQSPLAGVAVAGKGIEVPPQPKAEPIRVPTPEQMRPRVGRIPQEALI